MPRDADADGPTGETEGFAFMIDRFHFENFKSLKNVTLDLGRLTVLVGPNGCGKSSVLQGAHLLSQTGLARKTEKQEERPWHRLSSTFRTKRART